MSRFTSTRFFKVILIAAILIAVIYLNPVSILNPFRTALTFVASPFEKVFYSISVNFEQDKEFIQSIGQLKKENQDLLKQNQDLLSENANLHDVKSENDFLRSQLDLLPRDKYQLIACSVIGQDPNGTGNWLEIDRGSDDGIFVGMPVIISKGILIGRVQEVQPKNSKIVLLTNPKSTINVADSQTGAKGIVKGEYGLGIIYDMILQTDSVSAGNEVITSGIGGDIPRGLYVGTVQEVHPSEDHLFQQAVVISPVQISQLQMVFVIKQAK